jgi:hypothetical protein
MSKAKFDFGTIRTRVIPILKRVKVEDYPATRDYRLALITEHTLLALLPFKVGSMVM